MSQPFLSIKIEKGEDIRRFHLESNLPNAFETLLTQICNLYALNISEFNPGLSPTLKLVYKDDTNSDISISSTEELAYAMQYSNQKDPLALYVLPLSSSFNKLLYKEEKWRLKSEKQMQKKTERRDKRLSNGKIYGSLNIYDPDEIELYKSVLIELDDTGHRRMKQNLKFLKQYRQGNDFTEAIKKIQEFDERRSREHKLKREKKWAKKLKHKRSRNVEYPENDDLDEENDAENDNEDGADNDNDEESQSESGKENEVVGEPQFSMLYDWPDNITHLYIDGNNLLYIAKNIRNMTIKRKGSKAQEILIGSFELFSSLVKGLETVFIIFDYTKSVYEKTVGENTKFTIRSARPQFHTSDDALVSEAGTIPIKEGSLFVTSDRGLCTRLNALGTTVVKPKMFFNIVLSIIYGKDHKINLDDWFEDIEKKLDLVQIRDKTNN